MTAYFSIHPTHPQVRLIRRTVEILQSGGVIVLPTDSGYALACSLSNKEGSDRIRRIRQLDEKHNFTLLCRDLSEIALYARINNPTFRLLKAHTPGAYTFILGATREVPRRLQHPKRKTIGIRIPEHPITLALLEVLNEPLMSVSLILPGSELPLFNVDEIRSELQGQVALIVDGGPGSIQPTSIIDLTGDIPKVLRKGKGDFSVFL